MQISEISSKDCIALRSLVLRPGRPVEECVYPHDDDELSFHLGLMIGDEIMSIVSFYQEAFKGKSGSLPYRFRGMATHPNFRNKGFASKLLEKSFDILVAKGCNIVWCNARTSAASFYQGLGMEIASEEFDIPAIGPHYVMLKQL